MEKKQFSCNGAKKFKKKLEKKGFLCDIQQTPAYKKL